MFTNEDKSFLEFYKGLLAWLFVSVIIEMWHEWDFRRNVNQRACYWCLHKLQSFIVYVTTRVLNMFYLCYFDIVNFVIYENKRL